MAFWNELLQCMQDMKNKKNGADPCMYYQWTMVGLIICLSWIDDCMVWGPKNIIQAELDAFNERFDCNDMGRKPNTPAESSTMLRQASENEKVGAKRHIYYRSGVGKLLHVSRQCSAPNGAHIKAMHQAMGYCAAMPDRGWKLKPEHKWDDKDKSFQFRITDMSDSDYAKCPVTRRSVNVYITFLEGAPITVKSAMQRVVVIYVTKAETIPGVQCVQNMLYINKFLESIELKVELPMLLYMDNSGAIDLIHNWSASGRIRHMETRMFFLRDVKEGGILEIKWSKGSGNPADGGQLTQQTGRVMCEQGRVLEPEVVLSTFNSDSNHCRNEWWVCKRVLSRVIDKGYCDHTQG
eukprot:15365538-Ditylum_brightwellii.AAC.1